MGQISSHRNRHVAELINASVVVFLWQEAQTKVLKVQQKLLPDTFRVGVETHGEGLRPGARSHLKNSSQLSTEGPFSFVLVLFVETFLWSPPQMDE